MGVPKPLNLTAWQLTADQSLQLQTRACSCKPGAQCICTPSTDVVESCSAGLEEVLLCHPMAAG